MPESFNNGFFKGDQAASLRRMMANPAPKIVCMLSATTEGNRPLFLTNLASALKSRHEHILLVYAGQESVEASRLYGTHALPTLVEVAQQKFMLAQAVKNSKLGFAVSKLQAKDQNLLPLGDVLEQATNEVLRDLVHRYGQVIVDATLNSKHMLPISVLTEGQLLIEMTREPESMKRAYILVKHIYQQFGSVKIGVVVSGANNAHAALVFRNLAQVAKQFLTVDLEFFGAIPADEHIHRAAKLGRSVIDAFPQVSISLAFKSLAQRLNYQQISTAPAALASLA